MSHRILVLSRSFGKVNKDARQLLQNQGCSLMYPPRAGALTEDELIVLAKDAHGIIVSTDRVTARVIGVAEKLQVIAKYGVGVDNIDVQAATENEVVVTNARGANRVAVAELTVGLMLSMARRIPKHDKVTKAGAWDRTLGVQLEGKKLGIVGFGDIGKEVATRAVAGLGMEVLVYSRYRDQEFVKACDLQYVSLERLLQISDFVSLHSAFTPDRFHLIGEKELRSMQPTSYLINTARGELVDEGALCQALAEGWIAGAAIDVYAGERAADSPLLKAENVITTPHIGAYTYEAFGQMDSVCAENVIRVVRGQRPLHIANPQVYARKRRKK